MVASSLLKKKKSTLFTKRHSYLEKNNFDVRNYIAVPKIFLVPFVVDLVQAQMDSLKIKSAHFAQRRN